MSLALKTHLPKIRYSKNFPKQVHNLSKPTIKFKHRPKLDGVWAVYHKYLHTFKIIQIYIYIQLQTINRPFLISRVVCLLHSNNSWLIEARTVHHHQHSLQPPPTSHLPWDGWCWSTSQPRKSTHLDFLPWKSASQAFGPYATPYMTEYQILLVPSRPQPY